MAEKKSGPASAKKKKGGTSTKDASGKTPGKNNSASMKAEAKEISAAEKKTSAATTVFAAEQEADKFTQDRDKALKIEGAVNEPGKKVSTAKTAPEDALHAAGEADMDSAGKVGAQSTASAKPEEVVIDVEVSSERPAPTRQEIFGAWWKASRPPFYIATLVPLFLGYFAARNDVGSPSVLVFTGVLLVGFVLHLCANLANDLFDYLLGTDTQDTIGGSRGLQDGSITAAQLKLALVGCYGLAALLTLLGVWITGLWGLFFIALFGALASYYYVAPPVMYGYRALGEIFVFISMGLFMVGGSYYTLAGELSSHVLALSLPIGLGVAGILYYQSLPEIESDAAMGKKTLAGVLGPVRAVFLYKLWWPGIWFLVVTLYLADLTAWPALLGIVLGLPMYRKACYRLDTFGGDWFSLDKYGKYTRLMYMSMGVFLVLGVAVL